MTKWLSFKIISLDQEKHSWRYIKWKHLNVYVLEDKNKFN